MSTVQNVMGATNAAAGATAAARDKLGQKDFLELMMTQFRNQDPFKPLDSTQFLGQLAQFSTVSGIDGMQASLATLVDSYKSAQMLSGAALVGRSVLVPSDAAVLGAAGPVGGAIDVPEGVQQVVVQVKDAAGQLVQRYVVPAQAGLQEFQWDGVLQDGTRAAPGTYQLQALGLAGGQSASLALYVADPVASVTLDARTQALVLNTATQGTVPLASVRRIF